MPIDTAFLFSNAMIIFQDKQFLWRNTALSEGLNSKPLWFHDFWSTTYARITNAQNESWFHKVDTLIELISFNYPQSDFHQSIVIDLNCLFTWKNYSLKSGSRHSCQISEATRIYRIIETHKSINCLQIIDSPNYCPKFRKYLKICETAVPMA